MLKLMLRKSKLLEYIKEKRWNLRALSDEMGVDHSYVYRVINGKQDFGRKFIEGLMTACRDCSFDDLFIFKEVVSYGTGSVDGDEKLRIHTK